MKYTFCHEYKVLSLEQIQYNTLLRTTLYMLHYVMCMLVIIKDWGEDSECSRVAELQFWLKFAWKSMARPENGCLAMINNQFDRAWRILKRIMENVAQSRFGKLLKTYQERLTGVIAAKGAITKYWLRGVEYICKLDIFVFHFQTNC